MLLSILIHGSHDFYLFENNFGLHSIDLINFFNDAVGLFTRPFVMRYNGLFLIAMPSLNIVLTIFDIIIKVQSDNNKLNRFVSVFTQWCDYVHSVGRLVGRGSL